MAYTFLDNSLNTIGVLTNKGGQTNGYWGDSITHEIATSQDVLTSVSLSVDKPSVNIDTSGNQKTWNHVIQGLSFNIDGVGRQVNENDYLIYQEGTNGKYYLMAITQVDESAVQSGFHYKTVQGLNAAAYDLSRKTLRAKSFAQIPDNTQEKGTAQNILKYIFEDINWDVRTIGSFGAIDYDITEGTTAQAVLLDIIGMFEAEVDAYVKLNNWGKGANIFNKNGSIKRIFDFSTSLGKYRGETIRYDKNMVSITKTGARDSMYTKLYVNGNNITIADVNKGADFIVDDVANRKYNKLGSVSTPVTYLEGIITNSAIESPTALLAWGKKQLKILNHPRYNYQISATNDDKVQLGDTVIIQDTHASDPIYLKSKVISKTVSLADPVNNSFIVGEFSPIVIGADNGLEDTNQIMQLVNQANQTAINAQNKANENAKKIVDTRTNLEKTIDQKLQEGKYYSDSLDQKQKEAYNKFEVEINKGLEDAQKERDEISKKADDMLTTANSYADTMYSNAVAVAKTEASKALSDANTSLDEAKTDLTNGIASEASERQRAVQTVNSQAQDYATQAKSDAIEAAKTADGKVRKDFKETADSLSSTISQNKEDSDGKISTAQTTATQALNGLSTKVSQTDYDKKTGDLSTAVNTVTQTATETKNELAKVSKTVGSQSAKINTISNTVDGTTQTISDIQTEQGKQSGSIATLQSRADGFDATVTKVNNLSVGGRNLLLNSKVSLKDSGSSTYFKQSVTPDFYSGQKITASVNVKYTNIKSLAGIGFHRLVFAIQFRDGAGNVRYFDTQRVVSVIGDNFDERVSNTIDLSGFSVNSVPTANMYIQGITADYMEISNPKLETGTIPTDWSPAPEDLSSATAKVKLTADQAALDLSSYQKDADGRIRKAQSDITANANAIKFKVSQSDYNAKTNDLTKKYGQVKATADAVTTDVAKYKKSNDSKVSANEAHIETLNNQITSKVSQTDFNETTGKLSGNYTETKQTIKKISNTVTELQAKANAQGQVNHLMNTEFTPDLEGWSGTNSGISYVGISKSVTVNGSNVLNITHGSNTNWSAYRQKISDFVAGSTLSASVYARATSTGWGFAIDSYSSDGTRTIIQQVTIPTTNALLKIQKVTIPSDAKELYFSFWGNTAGTAVIYKPMLVFNSTVGDYVPGNYNNNSRVSALEVDLDGITGLVNDPKKGLSATATLAANGLSVATTAKNTATTAIQTARGTQTTVDSFQKDVKDVKSTTTQTAEQVTTEIEDRKNGDTNTLTQAKNFTSGSITSSERGLRSEISQSADGIIANIGATNLFPDSEFKTGQGYEKLSGVTTINPIENIDGQQHKTVTVTSTDANYHGYWTKGIPVTGNRKYSGSVKVHFTNNGLSNGTAMYGWWFYDKDDNRISTGTGSSSHRSTPQVSSPYWVELYLDGITAPVNAVTLKPSLIVSNAGAGMKAKFTMPSITATDVHQPYTPNDDMNTMLALFKDNWSIGINDNSGKLISGINGDTSGTVIQGKKLVINPDTTFNGLNFMNGALIKDASISQAKIGNLQVNSAQITGLDVSKLTGDTANFVTANIESLNADKLYGDTGYLGTVSAGRVINNRDHHLQLAAHGLYNDKTHRAQFELLSYDDPAIEGNMKGSLNYYSTTGDNVRGIRFKANQILAIDTYPDGAGSLYLSAYERGQVVISARDDRTNYKPIKASKFNVSSERRLKSDITDFDDGALEIVNKTKIHQYTKNETSEIGIIADEAPEELLSDDDKSISLYDYTSVLYKAVQELSQQVKELQDERTTLQ